MKKLFSFILFGAALLAFKNVTAQTGSDYYLPLRAGNYVTLHTIGNDLGWAARTTTYAIAGTDSISGKIYYREEDNEVADDGSFNHLFNVIWLCEDTAKDILIAAVGEGSTNVDSAMILPVAGAYFSSQALVPGYSTLYPYGGYFMADSTISDTATVGTPAGTFTNCIVRSETHYDSLGNAIFLEYHYYARGVGMVLNERVLPTSQAHTDHLTAYSATTAVHENNPAAKASAFGLSQNYPNPFNPSTTIVYRVQLRGEVNLKVYNVLGELVATLVNQTKEPGEYSVVLDGSRLSSGVYFVRLVSGNNASTIKILMTK